MHHRKGHANSALSPVKPSASVGFVICKHKDQLISKSLQGRSRGSTRGVEEGPGVRRRGPGTISEQIATRNLVDAGSFDDS